MQMSTTNSKTGFIPSISHVDLTTVPPPTSWSTLPESTLHFSGKCPCLGWGEGELEVACEATAGDPAIQGHQLCSLLPTGESPFLFFTKTCPAPPTPVIPPTHIPLPALSASFTPNSWLFPFLDIFSPGPELRTRTQQEGPGYSMNSLSLLEHRPVKYYFLFSHLKTWGGWGAEGFFRDSSSSHR